MRRLSINPDAFRRLHCRMIGYSDKEPPLRASRLSINPDAFRRLHCRMIGYSDKEPPLRAKLFLGTWNIVHSEY